MGQRMQRARHATAEVAGLVLILFMAPQRRRLQPGRRRRRRQQPSLGFTAPPTAARSSPSQPSTSGTPCPLEALYQELARTQGRLGAILALLDGVQAVELPVGYLDGLSRAELQELLKVERRHLVRVSEAAVRCGVAERHVHVLERAGDEIAEIVRSVVPGLGRRLDDPAVEAVIRRVLVLPSSELDGHGLIEGQSSALQP